MPCHGKPKLVRIVGWSQFKQSSGVVRRQADFNAAQGMRFGPTPSQAYPDQVPGAAVQSSGSSSSRRRHFLQKYLPRPKGGKPLTEKEVVAGLDRVDLPLPFDQNDPDLLSGQAVLLEEGAQIALSLLAPMMHDDPPWGGLDQAQLAAPDEEPDHPLWIGSVERHQSLMGTFEDRLIGLFQRPGHRIANGQKSPVEVSRNQYEVGFLLANRTLGRKNDSIAPTAILRKLRRLGWSDMRFSLQSVSLLLSLALNCATIASTMGLGL